MSEASKLGNISNRLPRRLLLDRASASDAIRGKFTQRIMPVYNASGYSPDGSNNMIRFNIVAARSAPQVFCDLQSVYIKFKLDCYTKNGSVTVAGGAITENAACLFQRIRILTSQGQVISDLNHHDVWCKIKDGYRSRMEKQSEFYQGYDASDGKVQIKADNNWLFVKITDSLFNSAPLLPVSMMPLMIEFHLADARRVGRADGVHTPTTGAPDYGDLDHYWITKPELIVDMYQLSERYTAVVLEAQKRGDLRIKYDSVIAYRRDVDGNVSIDFPLGGKRMVNSLWACAVDKTKLVKGHYDSYDFLQGKTGKDGIVSWKWSNTGYNGQSYQYQLPDGIHWDSEQNRKALGEFYIQYLKAGNLYRNPFTTTALSDFKHTSGDAINTEDPYTEFRNKHMVLAHRCALDPSNQLDSGINMTMANPQLTLELKPSSSGSGDAGLTMFLFAKYTGFLAVKSDANIVVE